MVYKGKSVLGRIAIGKIYIYKKEESDPIPEEIADTESEKRRFHASREMAKDQLEKLYEKTLKEAGEENAAIFEVHQMMLDDLDYVESIENLISTKKVNAEYAVAQTRDRFMGIFETMDDEYMRERAADVKDVSNRVIRILYGKKDTKLNINEPVILLADDLAPSETVQLDKSLVLSFVTRLGSTNSHTAVLARTMNVPALMGIDFPESVDGKTAIVDGYGGMLITDPDDKTIKKYINIQKEDEEKTRLLQTLKGKETVTKSGKKIDLFANIGGVKDALEVLKNDGEGVGLFRSEFLYIEAGDFPSEEEQFKAYRDVAETLADKKVIIRTLDIGADKQADYFKLPHEENPALGVRAIRICLDNPKIFKTQLRAILRASCYGDISVMYPMITSVWEIKRIKKIVEECKEELKKEGVPYRDIEQGIMIETPAAVLISDELAKEADFFSVGTNDLSQYMLAVDRQNPRLEDFFDPHHPAILKAIKITTENGHGAGIRVGICGELGSDPKLIKTLVDLGVDEMSVSPSQILKTREVIRELD